LFRRVQRERAVIRIGSTPAIVLREEAALSAAAEIPIRRADRFLRGPLRSMFYRSPVALSGRLHFLDALRGLAAMAVMFFHFFAQGVSPLHGELAGGLPSWLTQTIGHMFSGVDVFFVLSGFVIAFSMDGRTADLRYAGNFILRRSLRLDPPYWVAATLMLGYFLVLWPSNWHDFYLEYGGLRGIAVNLLYLQNLSSIYPAKSILDVSWTLCLEVQFYLTYLAILVAGHYVRLLTPRESTFYRRAIVASLVAIVAAWSLMQWAQAPSSNFAGRSWTFFLGVAMYAALTRGIRTVVVAAPLTALGTLFLWRHDIHGTATVLSAVAIYAAGTAGRLSTLLACRPLLYLGKISYSLYLLHMVLGMNLISLLAQTPVGHVASGWLLWTLAVGVSIGGADLLYRLVEAPSNRLSRRFKKRGSSAPRLAAAGVAA